MGHRDRGISYRSLLVLSNERKTETSSTNMKVFVRYPMRCRVDLGMCVSVWVAMWGCGHWKISWLGDLHRCFEDDEDQNRVLDICC